MRHVNFSAPFLVAIFFSLSGCKGDVNSDSASDATPETTTTGTSTGIMLPTTGTSSSTGSGGETTSTTAPPATTSSTTLPDPTEGGLACGGKIYKCSDGMDNDGDGKTDLDDPECTGPCDDDEASFQTGIPGDNVDCKQDCFFDGNSGQSEGCLWDLKCDPANPGAGINCEYDPNKNCDGMMTQSDECKMNCQQFVPNGCDCFGCCTIDTPNGEVNIFLNSGPDCSLINLDACVECTPQIDDCGNSCNPDDCELCFGETELPEGCMDPGGCEDWQPCLQQADCPPDFFCVTGCCIPPPEG
jgi:hypothetical protein